MKSNQIKNGFQRSKKKQSKHREKKNRMRLKGSRKKTHNKIKEK